MTRATCPQREKTPQRSTAAPGDRDRQSSRIECHGDHRRAPIRRKMLFPAIENPSQTMARREGFFSGMQDWPENSDILLNSSPCEEGKLCHCRPIPQKLPPPLAGGGRGRGRPPPGGWLTCSLHQRRLPRRGLAERRHHLLGEALQLLQRLGLRHADRQADRDPVQRRILRFQRLQVVDDLVRDCRSGSRRHSPRPRCAAASPSARASDRA